MPGLELEHRHDGVRCDLGTALLICDLQRLQIGEWATALCDVTHVRVSTVLHFIEISAVHGTRRFWIAAERSDEDGLERLGALVRAAVEAARVPGGPDGGPDDVPGALRSLLER